MGILGNVFQRLSHTATSTPGSRGSPRWSSSSVRSREGGGAVRSNSLELGFLESCPETTKTTKKIGATWSCLEKTFFGNAFVVTFFFFSPATMVYSFRDCNWRGLALVRRRWLGWSMVGSVNRSRNHNHFQLLCLKPTWIKRCIFRFWHQQLQILTSWTWKPSKRSWSTVVSCWPGSSWGGLGHCHWAWKLPRCDCKEGGPYKHRWVIM